MRESKNERRTRNSTVTWITSETTMGKKQRIRWKEKTSNCKNKERMADQKGKV